MNQINQIDKMRKHENDTGSSQVQIMALTADIARLAKHVAEFEKDFTSRRSILKKVAQRRRFLKYLKRTDLTTYKQILHTLGMKK